METSQPATSDFFCSSSNMHAPSNIIKQKKTTRLFRISDYRNNGAKPLTPQLHYLTTSPIYSSLPFFLPPHRDQKQSLCLSPAKKYQ